MSGERKIGSSSSSGRAAIVGIARGYRPRRASIPPVPASADPTSFLPPADAFGFGRNWQQYVSRHLNPERQRIAEDSVRALLGVSRLDGRSFLDIGAGSGLFSLAAVRLGAAQIVSVDVDEDSAASCRLLREREQSPDHWQVVHGSILDPCLGEKIAPADVVYSWGVLHHTGDMWLAIRNAAALVRPGGLLAIAIYNDIQGKLVTSARWVPIKRFYNRAPTLIQRLMAATYVGVRALAHVAHGRNPVRIAREYRRQRGMAITTDVADWLGGYPYEYASAAEIVAFCERELGFHTRTVVELNPGDNGNNEFVFERPA